MIFWFSGTGNSYWAAKELGKTLNEPLVDMAAAIRSGRLNYYVHESEKVGFVFPVYFMGLPSVVDKFIEIMQLSGKQNPEIFAVLTCGQSCGMADELLEKALGKRSLKLYSAYRLIMPDDYVIMYNVGGENEMKKLAS
ncbi:MAG: EFR1 family ferrodoxin, partial [Oscillospiraceae bacterium]|nr:EFR1 family ferrodoxin [Oscillospiraceae bacterium]